MIHEDVGVDDVINKNLCNFEIRLSVAEKIF